LYASRIPARETKGGEGVRRTGEQIRKVGFASIEWVNAGHKADIVDALFLNARTHRILD
jgi:hypothetical protein